ncbi:hypothetical protein [Sphingomonas asaccharolytica]|uniref:hypothetical protein n=1 Tax=Sphingomonas asaccharolytica TaxID=40681 RepID=UPI00083086CB|nr:hypothetical protein [Sphingomonas asaccharolytica]
MKLQNKFMRIVVNIDGKIQFVALGCAALLSLQAGSANAKDAAPRVVWGKAGVSSELYHDDALACGMNGLASNIDNTKEVKTLARASQQLEGIDASAQASIGTAIGPTGQPDPVSGAENRAIQEQGIIAAARPDKQYAGIKETMFQVVRRCMIDRGYAKIVLTENQRKHYDGLKGGANARRAYIHELASDPHVLATQREAAAQ